MRAISRDSQACFMLSLDIEKGAMTAEAGAERRHPPNPPRACSFSAACEHEIHAGTADIAVVAQNRGAPSGVVFRQANPLANRGEDFAASGMKNPSGDVRVRDPARPGLR